MPIPGRASSGYIALLMIAVYAVRSLAAALHIGGPVSLIEFNQIQAVDDSQPGVPVHDVGILASC